MSAIDPNAPAFPNAQRLFNNDTQSWVVHSVGGMPIRLWLAANENIGEGECFDWELCEDLAGPRPQRDPKLDPIEWQIWQAKWQAEIRLIRADALIAAYNRKEPA